MPFPTKTALLPLTLLAAAWRFPALFANHFHADEALFASWARLIAIWRDPLLLTQAVDKPPLLFYQAALFSPLFGPVEWAPRWPNLIVSIMLVPLVGVLAWRLYGDSAVALTAAALVAASPLAIQFSATVFTDPLLAFFLTAACVFAVAQPRPFWAGLCFGLAAATKHQAWLFLPLLLGLAWLHDWRREDWWRALPGLLLPLALLGLWQVARGEALDLIGRQWRNIGGLRPAWSWELAPRFAAWSDLWNYLFGTTLGLLALAALLWSWLPREPGGRSVLSDRLFSLFVAAYMAAHGLSAIPAWDRYLLPLVPLLALLTARFLVAATRRALASWPRGRLPATAVLLLLLCLLMLPGAAQARAGRFPVGGRPDADEGAWQVRQLLSDAPYGTVLYDHWYSWHWRYAFIDKGVYNSWFPTPAALAEDLVVFGNNGGARYLVVPQGDVALPVLRAAQEAGFAAQPVLRTTTEPGMILYRLQGGAG